MNWKDRRPEIISRPEELRAAVDAYRRADGGRIGLVPTMGALHEGHLALVERSQEECEATIVTIFVNPTQFGPGEDLDKYPRTFEADVDKLAAMGVPWVFAPTPDVMYPEDFATYVEVGGVAEPLEGELRPGHFRGVATVVLKLFNIAGADVAYFGHKDYQQTAVIRRMVKDLDVPIEIVVCPTVRELDGLAMSSRNAYLDENEREQALVLFRSLQKAASMVRGGERDAGVVLTAMHSVVHAAPDAVIDYIALVDPDTLAPVDRIEHRVIAALAVRIGKTRLIDNAMIGT